MAEYVEILADIALEGIFVNTPFRIGNPLHNVALKLQDKYTPDEVTQMAMISIHQPAEVERFLLQQKYIDMIEPNTHLLKLTEKGEKAKELGGHIQYKEWVAIEERKKAIEEFPKKKWYLYEPLRIIIAVILTAIVTIPISYMLGKKSSIQSVPINNLRSIQSAPLPNKALLKPKTSDKKDSL